MQLVLALVAFFAAALARDITRLARRAIEPEFTPGHWVATWVSMPQLTESSNLPPPPFNTSTVIFQNSTIRQTLHMTVPGNQIRVRFSNAFGLTDLTITAATVALPTGGQSGVAEIDTTTLQTLTFSGSPSFTIPNAAQVVSDPLNFPVAAGSELAVTLFLADGQTGGDITSHPGSRATSFIQFGNSVNARNLTNPEVVSLAHWYFVSAVETWSQPTTSGFVIVGDSITDGRGSTTDGNDRWPDQLFTRMQANPATADISVLNQAAGGNRILNDGLGPNALGRIDRDVLATSGAKFAMIFEGVNDIGTADATTEAQDAIVAQLIGAFNQMITRVHAIGLPMFGATITPFGGFTQYDDGKGIREAGRQAVNNFIRTSGRFDAVFDFDAVARDPANPTALLPAFDSGDHLHMNPQGYAAIAASIPLTVFATNGMPQDFGFT